MVHNHATQMLSHEIIVQLALFTVGEGIMAVTFEDEDFTLAEGFDSFAEVIVVGLHLALEDDLAVALEARSCGEGRWLFELSVVTEALRYCIWMNTFGHYFFLKVS